jgi:hypothetical protein
MTVATLTFDLEKAEDKRDFDLMMRATKMALVLSHLDEALRSKVKYEELPSEVSDAYQKARDMLHEAASEEDIDIDSLFN